MYKKKCGLYENGLHIDAVRSAYADRYIQVAAVWTESTLENEAAWKQFYAIKDNFLPQAEENGYRLIKEGKDLDGGARGIILAVEGARILNLRAERLNALYECGVRVLTLQWKGEDCIGGGYDTECTLKPFGRETVKSALGMGMTVDVSHASGNETDDVLDIAEEMNVPVIASHSDVFALCPHTRNLTDERIERIKALGGLIGISFVREHLEASGNADTDTVIRHIMYLLDMGCENVVSFGCDFDGVNKLPDNINGIESMPPLYEKLISRGVPKDTADRLFYKNAYDYFKKNM